MTKTLLKNAIALLIGVGLAALLVEGGVRLLAGTLGLTPYMHYHEKFGWTARPNVVKRHASTSGEFEVEYSINSHGFRGPDYPVERRGDGYRIVVLGDSTGFGWGVDERRTFAGILDEELDDVEVINLALSGFGIDQSYLRFLEEGVRFRPDLVILQVSPNDFEEIQYSFFNQKGKPQFLLRSNGALELTNVPVRAIGPKAEEFFRYSLPLPFKEWLGWNSFAFNLLNERYYGIMRRRATGPAGTAALYTPASVNLFNAIQSELGRRVAAIGARGFVVFTGEAISQNRYIEPRGLEVIDLYPVFEQIARERGVSLYFTDGYHWNATGHRVVAEQLKRRILALRTRGTDQRP